VSNAVMRTMTLAVAALLAGCNPGTDTCTVDGVDTCALCEAKPITCGTGEFVLTWGCHYPPSPSATKRTCEPLPAPCAGDRSCACLRSSFDGGPNCSPGRGATCTTDGGAFELYCSPP
jgi:hypothetical protein